MTVLGVGIGIALGWLTAAIAVATWLHCWPAPGERDEPRDADTEESGW